jgi:hypothetical protein
MNGIESAQAFVRSLANLAESLANREIVVRRLHCDWASFGSWIIEVSSGESEEKRTAALRRLVLFAHGSALGSPVDEPGPVVFRVTWDGRDKWLTLESTATEVMTMHNQWTLLDEDRDCGSHDAALALAGEWLASCLKASG